MVKHNVKAICSVGRNMKGIKIIISRLLLLIFFGVGGGGGVRCRGKLLGR